ncbi:MAG: hypothetical protein IPO22_00430 [Anaerolineales bacterium]|jgi:hypothetical protein|nr:hypothetical protein [Anaerolineales bacterium]
MTFKNSFRIIVLIVAAAFVVSSCSEKKNEPLLLETFTKNSVSVSIYLNRTQDGQDTLIATFVPQEGLHLYSKDIPRSGVEGLGRPTLLELTQNSQMKAAGSLIESVPAQVPDFEPKDLLVYPSGSVTLTLPVTLQSSADQANDEISITYMACSDVGCKAPVVGQVISLYIPPAQ